MAEKNLESSILIIAFNRPKLLSNLLNSLESAGDLSSKNIVIVQQIGNEDVKNVIFEFKNKYKNIIVKTVDGNGKTSTENISNNRLLGLNYCFDSLGSDYVIALEDDVQVSSDIFHFTSIIMKNTWDKVGFRGINYGSHEPFSNITSLNYSYVRYGIHGPASAITNKTWKKINTIKNQKRSKYIIFDALFEPYLKTGFMVTPENSRYLDLGYGGTHTPNVPNDPYFSKLKESFVENNIPQNAIYKFNQVSHSWRIDAISYNAKDNLKYKLLYFVNYKNDNFFFYKIERALYRLLILKSFTRLSLFLVSFL